MVQLIAIPVCPSRSALYAALSSTVCVCECVCVCVYARERESDASLLYGVALVSRNDKIIGLFCKRAL